jgi:phosphomethylpyrimidine synthase
MTELEAARRGIVTPAMQAAAAHENMHAEDLRQLIASGEAVLPWNKLRGERTALAVGKGLTTKVNANIGTSQAYPEAQPELEKLAAALAAGAHSIMDLSTGGDIDGMRRSILARSPVMVGTVPIYQVLVDAVQQGKNVTQITADDIFAGIEKHCRDGADFITVHCGVTAEVLAALDKVPRVMGIVSRGGSFMAAWIRHHQAENPLFTQYDRLLSIAKEYDVTLSLGDGLRPGCLADATDTAQLTELMVLGQLVTRARDAGVQVMVEGPGHVPLNQVVPNMQLAKTICHGAPLYVLGPLVTDVSPGYDHITAAIGGALAAANGADFLCYVTPAEHLGLPAAEDVHQGVIASRIAAHAADIAKGVKGADEWDRQMSRARKALAWDAQIDLALDPVRAKALRQARNVSTEECCSMCGQFCAYK